MKDDFKTQYSQKVLIVERKSKTQLENFIFQIFFVKKKKIKYSR